MTLDDIITETMKNINEAITNPIIEYEYTFTARSRIGILLPWYFGFSWNVTVVKANITNTQNAINTNPLTLYQVVSTSAAVVAC